MTADKRPGVLRSGVLLVLSMMTDRYVSAAQSPPEQSMNERVTLEVIAEYPRRSLLDISRDGKRLLMWEISRSTYVFRLPSPPNSSSARKRSGNLLLVVDRQTGKTLAATDLDGFPRSAFFLPDASGALYEDFGRNLQVIRKLWRFADTETPRGFCPSASLLKGGVLYPLDDDDIVGFSHDTSTGASTVLRASVGSCVLKKIIEPDANGIGTQFGDSAFSRTGRRMAFVLRGSKDKGQRPFKEIAVVRVDDLKVEARMHAPVDWRFEKLIFSQEGGTVLAAVSRNRLSEDRESAVCVFDASSGKLTRMLDIDASYGLSLSPDGKYLATASRFERGQVTKIFQSKVSITDFRTGSLVATGTYPWRQVPRNDPWAADVHTLTFSPDSRELLTSTLDTRVWRVPDLSRQERAPK